MRIEISGEDHKTCSAMAIYLMKFLEIEMDIGVELENVDESLSQKEVFHEVFPVVMCTIRVEEFD